MSWAHIDSFLAVTLLVGGVWTSTLVGCADSSLPEGDAALGGDVGFGGDGGRCGPDSCEIGARRCGGSHRVAECIRDEQSGCGLFEVAETCNSGEICQDGECVADSCVDEDGDGYGPGCPKGDDCDDTDDSIHPGAVDECGDGIDQNCSGTADEGCDPTCPDAPCSPGESRCTSSNQVEVCERDSEGCGTWGSPLSCPDGGECTESSCSNCTDEDGDGFGEGCAPGGDCDDNDDTVNEGASELCDGVDNDCDGDVDEEFDDLGGECEVGRGACAQTGTVVCTSNARSTTCDATAGEPVEERCGDGIDNDCDGEVDEGFDIVGTACTRGTGECQTSGTHECDPNERTSTFCDAPEPDDGSTEVCDGADNDCDGSTDEGDVCNTCVDDAFEENDSQSNATDLTSSRTLEDLRSCGPCDDGFDHDWFTLGAHSPGDSISVELTQPTGTNVNGQTHANLEIEMFCDGHFCDAIRGRTSPMSGTFDGFCASGFSDCSSGSTWTFYVYPRCKDSPDGNPTIGTPYSMTRR